MGKYYSYNRLLSYNSFVNFSMGGRGIGKSYGAKEIVIKDFLKDGKQTVYVRRTDIEIEKVKETFWNDIRVNYQDIEFTTKGEYGYINGEIAVYFISLSTSANRKSASYPFVNKILFDEYVIAKGQYKRYLKNEMIIFFELVESIFRSRDDCKVFILSNALSYVNPFFTYFDIEPKKDQRFWTYKDIHKKDHLICVEIVPPNEEFVKEKANTKFMRLVKGTDYYNYSLNNEVLEDNTDFILKTRPSGKYLFMCSFLSDGVEYSFWINSDTGLYYCDNISEKSSSNRYYIRSEDMTPNFKYLKQYRGSVSRIRYIRKAIADGDIRFNNQENKKFVQEELIRHI